MKRSYFERLEFLDYALSGIAGCLAVFSLGMGLGTPSIGYTFMAIIVVGTLSSYFIHRAKGNKLAIASGLVYTLLVLSAFLFRYQLNTLLPDEGIPLELVMAGALAWMLALGSFALWRDTTLIFQAVPTVALFGLIGAWDTFVAAPFAFFGFLMCFAMLFARAHSRLMMFQAQESGFERALLEVSEREANPIEGYHGRLKEGPWRWMAGPEWALASALGIVLLSLLGAPVLQQSVQGVVGNVRLNVPSPKTSARVNQAFDPFLSYSSQSTSIGNGPTKLPNKPLFYTNLERPTYLRARTYNRYLERGWGVTPSWQSQQVYRQATNNSSSPFAKAIKEGRKAERFEYQVFFERRLDASVPIPGIPEHAGDGGVTRVRPDLTLEVIPTEKRVWFPVRRVDNLPFEPKDAAKDIEYEFQDQNPSITNRVRQFAIEAAGTTGTDYEKALRIKQAIERQAVYDLNAPAVPTGRDPVDFFLFESKRGYCDLFASAMVICAQAAGLPARYVTGYYPVQNERDERGLLTVHESEAHAWAELKFEGIGWLPFDPTEGAPNLGQSTEKEEFWESTKGKVVMLLILVFGGILGPYITYRAIKLKQQHSDPLRRQLGRNYHRFAAHLEKLTGKVKRPAQTPYEYLEIIRPMLGEAEQDAEKLTNAFVNALYAPPKTETTILSAEVEAFRKTYKRTKRPPEKA